MVDADFRTRIAERIFEEHRTLAERWFVRLDAYLNVPSNEIFPSESRLDHIPALIQAIGRYVGHPDEEAIAANTAILDKARELGSLRYAQSASLHQVLREYQLLSDVLVGFVEEVLARPGLSPTPAEAISIVSRLYHVVAVFSQATVETFVALYNKTIQIQNERLEEFTRMAAHEWRQPLSVLQFGVGRLLTQAPETGMALPTLESLDRNVKRLVALTHNLEAVARIQDVPSALVQEMSLAVIAKEAARQLRDMAMSHDVEIRIDESLPVVCLDVGRLELALLNLLSNAIKYADQTKADRFVAVHCIDTDDVWHHIGVRDNGVGIPERAQATIFRRFTRAHASSENLSEVSGLGLGLSIVEDCVRALGGEISVQSQEGLGTTFTLKLPIAVVA